MGQWARGTLFRDLLRLHDLTLNGTIAWNTAQGRVGGYGSLSTGATNGNYASFTTFPVCTSGTVTVAGWFNPTVSNQTQMLVEYRDGSKDWSLGQVANTGLLMRFGNGTGATASLIPTGWTHVIAQISGTAATIWLNGVSAATGTSTAIGTTTSRNLYVGYDANAANQEFTGSFDDIRLYYGVVFTDQMAMALYLASKSQFDPTLNWLQMPSVKASSAPASTIVRRTLFLRSGSRGAA